jgi:glutamate/aspartate transport system substrate-binding protein
MKALLSTSLLLASLSLAGAAGAEELTGTLKKVKESGTITLGVRDSSIPFSYLDDKQSYQGYSIDLCLKTVLAIQKHLGLTSLKTVLNPVTSATRIPLMANGTIDLECGSTTNNLERQKQVAFAPTMFVTATRLLAKKSSNIKSMADLKGKTLVSSAGTANLKQVTIMNNEQNLGITIVSAKDHAESFLMVETGRAAAFAMDDILLAGLAANSKTPNDYDISKEPLSVEPYGIMMRKDDPAFKKVVDAALTQLYTSGDAVKIYNKWFLSPIPPKGVNMNFPLTPQLKYVYAHPTDSGDPAAYAAVPEAQKNLGKKKK